MKPLALLESPSRLLYAWSVCSVTSACLEQQSRGRQFSGADSIYDEGGLRSVSMSSENGDLSRIRVRVSCFSLTVRSVLISTTGTWMGSIFTGGFLMNHFWEQSIILRLGDWNLPFKSFFKFSFSSPKECCRVCQDGYIRTSNGLNLEGYEKNLRYEQSLAYLHIMCYLLPTILYWSYNHLSVTYIIANTPLSYKSKQLEFW